MRTAALAAAVAIAAGACSSATAAEPAPPPDLRDARYCEVLEMRGEIPDATVNVWNTIAFSDCPQPKFERLDPAAIAAQTGASLVLVNGPRYFVMDSAVARIGTRVRIFGGMRMRRVAQLPIAAAADLAQRAYAERTVERVNTWQWERGSRVYELLAPDGATYVMQSYTVMRDPLLTIGGLRRLGDRLALPEGWRYRTRRLRRNLELGAEGEATILQDDLLNTYQRVPGRRGA